jgi:hypothetical protein
MEWLSHFDNAVTPMVRQRVNDADNRDEMVQFEGQTPGSGTSFTISVSENPVLGPLN